MKVNLLDKKSTYIIGVSGGCDSMYLLDTLSAAGYQLVVCHVNYHYRHDSDEDTQLVEAYCQSHQIPLYIKSCDPSDYETGNFQQSARDIRYTFYKEIAEKYETDLLLVAHHKDDFLENVLMQLEKHQTYFYLGIQEESKVNGLKVKRILLDTYKHEILDTCHQKKIPYRDDYTNFETHFKRDKIRNTVLNNYSSKEKEELYQKALQHNSRMKDLKIKYQPYFDQYKQKGFIDYTLLEQSDVKTFVYLLMYEEVQDEVTSSLVEEVCKQMQSSKPNIQMNLPVNKVFIKEYNNIYVSNIGTIENYEYVVNKGELIETPFFQLSTTGHINCGVDVTDDEYPLTIRNMRENDVIKTTGGTKKVTRLFINKKVPLNKRKIYPIVLNQYGQIILIPHIAKNSTHLSTNAQIFVII